ncbi:MAG TPA: hypothetical protein PLP01_05845 [Phycisphaerae bacterium]|nr:hypothetical protein [Phycisphaerae bacterium]
MAHGIQSVCWGCVTPDVRIAGLEQFGVVTAVWPSPIDADACFLAAGFAEFDDSDEAWDQDWRELIEAIVQGLGRFGPPQFRAQARVFESDEASLGERIVRWLALKPRPLRKVDLELAEQVVAVTSDDRFGKVLIDFGTPVRSSLMASSGHPILWLAFASPDADPESFLRCAAGEFNLTRRTLDWRKLSPVPSRDEDM